MWGGLTPESDKNPVWGSGVLLWAFCGGWLIGMNYCCVSRQVWADSRVIIYWLEVVNDVLGAVECRFPNDFNVLNLHLDEICLGYLR